MNKEEVIYDLFQQCSFSEQLTLLEKLLTCFKRDFINFLPLEIVTMILSHLEPLYVIKSCMQVSWGWYRRIKSCEPYWREQLFKLHRSGPKHEAQSYREATLSVLKLETQLSFMTSSRLMHAMPYPDSSGPIGNSLQWLFNFCQKENSLFLYSADLQERFNLSHIEEFRMKMPFYWSWSTKLGALFYFINNTWVYIVYPEIDLSIDSDTQLEFKCWNGGREYSDSSFQGCSDCRLVTASSGALYNLRSKCWNLDVVVLHDELASAKEQTLSFQCLPSTYHVSQNAMLLFGSVIVVPAETTSSVICPKHFLYVQFGVGFVKYELTCCKDYNIQISPPLVTFCPSNMSLTDICDYGACGMPSKMKLSKDRSLIALMLNRHLVFIQDLVNNQSYLHSVPSPGRERKFQIRVIQVDSLYVVLGVTNSEAVVRQPFYVTVLSTTTGRVVYSSLCCEKTDIHRILPREFSLAEELVSGMLSRTGNFHLCTLQCTTSDNEVNLYDLIVY